MARCGIPYEIRAARDLARAPRHIQPRLCGIPAIWPGNKRTVLETEPWREEGSGCGMCRGVGEHLAQHRVESDRRALVANFGDTWLLGELGRVSYLEVGSFSADYIDDAKQASSLGEDGTEVKVRIYSICILRRILGDLLR